VLDRLEGDIPLEVEPVVTDVDGSQYKVGSYYGVPHRTQEGNPFWLPKLFVLWL